MAKYTLEEIMCGEKYNIESDVFMEVFRLVEQKTDAKMIREQLNTIYVKHALLVAKKNVRRRRLYFGQRNYNRLLIFKLTETLTTNFQKGIRKNYSVYNI